MTKRQRNKPQKRKRPLHPDLPTTPALPVPQANPAPMPIGCWERIKRVLRLLLVILSLLGLVTLVELYPRLSASQQPPFYAEDQIPDVITCDTISNVRVTERALEETILLDFNIQRAGIRRLSFLLPATMADSQISVEKLRQKTVEPVGKEAGSPLRVTIELQDEEMDSFTYWSRTTGC